MKLLSKMSENLIYVSMLGFFLVGSLVMSLVPPKEIDAAIDYRVRNDLPELPILKTTENVPMTSAQGVMAMDIESRVILFQKNPDEQLLPASTTKIMTALTALDYYEMDTTLKVNGIRVDGRKMGLSYGQEMVFQDFLQAMLIYSANDAAEVIADNYPGGREAFIEAMNLKAKRLNMQNTNYANPTGLDNYNNVSTARDMIYLTEAALKNSTFSETVRTKEKVLSDENGNIAYDLVNTNELLGKVDGVLGVKTGWTENARENLVSYIERDGHRVIIVLLGSQDRFGESESLIEWIFDNYEWRALQVPYSSL